MGREPGLWGRGCGEVGLRRTADGGRASRGWHEPAAGPGRGTPGTRGPAPRAPTRVRGSVRVAGRAWLAGDRGVRPGPGPAGSAGKGLFFGEWCLLAATVLVLKPCLWGFLHRLQLSAGVLGCQGVLVLGVKGGPWCGREEPLQHLLGCGRGGCVWGGTEKRNVTEILFGYSAEVVTFLSSISVHIAS